MRTKAIIHIDRFLRNLETVRNRIGKERHICVPVKADAYGHGAVPIANASLEAGASYLGVATLEEGIELKNAGIKVPILLLSQSHIMEIPAIIYAGLIPFVSDSIYIDALSEQARYRKTKLPVHLKIDTGMGRSGCHAEEALSLAQKIEKSSGLNLAGVATHFACADSTNPQGIEYTKKQLAIFNDAVNKIKNAGIDPGIVHAANSGAVILHPDSWLDMVRPGIFLYGYKTADEKYIPGFPFEPLKAEPVMELRSMVVFIKKVKKGESVSYGQTWTAKEDTNIATLPVGYADGLPRHASGKWQVVINGKEYEQVGRICMDQCCVDIGLDSDVKRWDEAVIFGGEAKDALSLAEAAKTIPYEITCGISKRVIKEYSY